VGLSTVSSGARVPELRVRRGPERIESSLQPIRLRDTSSATVNRGLAQQGRSEESQFRNGILAQALVPGERFIGVARCQQEPCESEALEGTGIVGRHEGQFVPALDAEILEELERS